MTNSSDVKWEQVALGDVCEVRRGNTITRKSTKSGCVPVVAGGLSSPYTHNVANRPANTVTVSGSGANAGFVNFWDVPIYASDCSTVVAKKPNNLLSVFIYRFLQTQQNYIYKNLKRGAAQPHVYPKDISKLIIPIPSLAEQKRIVAILDEAFAAIATATANTKKNIANAQELFDSELNSVFQSPAESSADGGTVRTVKIMDIVKPLTTTDPRKQPEESFEYIDVSSVSRITHSIRATSPTLGCDAPSRARRLVRAGDVLFATIRPTLQRIAVVPARLDQAVCSTGYFVLRPKPDVDGRFLFYYLFSQPFSDEMALLQRGASYPAVSDRDVKEHMIHIPPLPEQKRIAIFLDKLSAEKQTLVETYKTKIHSLAELKQSLLHQAFTGALTSK